MIDTAGLTRELEGLASKISTPDIELNISKAADEFKALNMDLVGRAAPALNDVSKILEKQKPRIPDLGALALPRVPSLGDIELPSLPDLELKLDTLKSSLPRAGEELNNGLKGMASALNDFPKDIEPTVRSSLKAATTVQTNLQAAMPGLQKSLSEVGDGLPIAAAKVKPALESASNDIANAIVGSNVQANFNNIALTLPTPAAMAETVSAISEATKKVIPTVEVVTSKEVQGTMVAALNGIKGDLGGATANLGGVLAGMKIPDLKIPNLGDIVGDKLGGLADNLTGNFSDMIPSITGGPISDILHKANGTLDVVKGSLGLPSIPGIDNIAGGLVKKFTDGPVGDALDLLQSTPNLGLDIGINIGGFESKLTDLQGRFGSVSSMLSGGLSSAVSGAIGGAVSGALSDLTSGLPGLPSLPGLPDIGALNISTALGSSLAVAGNQIVSTNVVAGIAELSEKFPILNNLEEASAEVSSALVQPIQIEVSWTETYKDDLVNKDTIIPQNYYHYIILPMGTIQRSKPVGTDTTLKVAIVGGYNVFRNEPGVLTADSITVEQAKGLRKLCKQFIEILPGINIYGKGQLTAQQERGAGGNPEEPGIDVEKLVKSLNGRSEVENIIPQTTPRGDELGKPISDRVVYQGGMDWFTANKIRNQLIQQSLMKILDQAAKETGLYVTIHSGGQMSKAEAIAKGGIQEGDDWFLPNVVKAVRTGSVRHDNGYAADIWLYTDADRKDRLVPGVSKNPPAKALQYIRACKALGATGIGVGPNYMNGSGIHIDITPQGGKWAKKGAAIPSWLAAV
jgi:hypothetical protein